MFRPFLILEATIWDYEKVTAFSAYAVLCKWGEGTGAAKRNVV